jgi:lysophospholipase L1-like esterase
MKAKPLLISCVLIALLLRAGEYLIDLWFGDGDGIITRYNLHQILLSMELILLTVAAGIFIVRIIPLVFHPSKGWLAQAGKVFLVLIFLAVIGLLAELLSRIVAPAEGTFDRLYPAENARHPFPYVMFKGKSGALTGYGSERYNAHGYRGAYPVMPKPPEEFRIIVLGGSAVWEGDTMLTEYLQQALHQQGQTAAAVYNCGIVAANSTMQWITVMNEVADLHPDLIIFYDGANDILHPLHYDPRPGYPFNFLIYENNPFLMRPFPALLMLAYKSNLFRLAARRYLAERISKLTSLRKKHGYLTDAWQERIARVYLTNQKKTASFCHSTGIHFLTFFQPSVYSKKILSDTEEQFVSVRSTEQNHFTRLTDKIRQHVARDSLMASCFIDLSGAFDHQQQTIFRDDIHMSNEGRRWIASLMATAITIRSPYYFHIHHFGTHKR